MSRGNNLIDLFFPFSLIAFHGKHRPPLVAGGKVTYTYCVFETITITTKIMLNFNDGYIKCIFLINRQ